ncbi:uncharacterized protein LOC143041332 [Oratosquilla oratoria]|uniref:uncharacterized protein LOC143041332 n=1 Tax=Oratosquilla oratoria TaxID=337810 RepID=UPI003F762DFB
MAKVPALEHHKKHGCNVSRCFKYHKARDLGITEEVGLWLLCFLTNRHQQVPVDGIRSWPYTIFSGVPLGPKFILGHISDIKRYILHYSVSSFVDDTKVLREVSTNENTQLLQTDLQALHNWAQETSCCSSAINWNTWLTPWGKDGLSHIQTQYGSNVITQENVNDLGVILNCDGTFTVHIVSVAKKSKIPFRLYSPHHPNERNTAHVDLI